MKAPNIRFQFATFSLALACATSVPAQEKPVEILKSAYGPAVYTRALEQHELPRGDQGADQEKSAELMTSAFGPAVLTRALEQRELPRGDEGADQEKSAVLMTSAFGPAVLTRALEQHQLPRGDEGADQEKSAVLMTSAFGPAVLTRALEQHQLPRGDEGADQEKSAVLMTSAFGPAVLTRALEQHQLPRGDEGADQEKSAVLMTSAFGPAVLTRALEQHQLPRGDEGADQEKSAVLMTSAFGPAVLTRALEQHQLPRGDEGADQEKSAVLMTSAFGPAVYSRVLEQSQLPADTGHSLPQELIDRLTARVTSKNKASSTESTEGSILFQLPVRQGITNTRPGYFSISNYVDQDELAPDSLLDYNCGMRTYDLEDGFNHNGIDYFNFPFGWLTMQQDGAAVIAAADGVIIEKHDGEPDMNCEFSDDAVSNTVILEHADGSITIYAHMKRNSVTTKAVGDSVEKGDYLGIIGSSGFSTGPHLHFGVIDPQGNLIEPHEGACNSLNDESWWEAQEEYYETGISLIATHSEIPEFPDCPGIEQPFLEDQFEADDSVFFSIFLRDALMGEVGTIEVLDPNGVSLVTFPPLEYTDTDHAAAYLVVYGLDFSPSALSGAYTYRVTYAGQTMEHVFYIDSGPDAPPPVLVANNAQNGLYFDPSLDGEGYNFVTTPAGTIIYFYGSDRFGNRLWLISDLIPGDFGPGSVIEVTMFESTGGTFGAPVPSARALSVWGTLGINFTACDSATATLNGVDGVKVSQLIQLAGVAGTGCGAGGATSDSPWSGLWFAIADDGEGYNLVVAANGSILYFYGFKADGRRLWLISDLIVDELQVGVDVNAIMYESVDGDFDNPVPSAQSLVQWGDATITLVDCSSITIVMTGTDGSKTSVTIRLAGVIGLDCSA